VTIDDFLGKIWETGPEFNRIFPVCTNLNGNSLGPESIAAPICIVVNVKGEELESDHRLSVIADEPGAELNVLKGSG
jgi:hypothetical protein